jgi:hypothetical protein
MGIRYSGNHLQTAQATFNVGGIMICPHCGYKNKSSDMFFKIFGQHLSCVLFGEDCRKQGSKKEADLWACPKCKKVFID